MKSIKETFKERNNWVNHRASAIFPCYLNKNNDQVLVFQNYWLWKNNIKDLAVYVSLIDSNGSRISKKKIKINNHNEIFIKNEFKLKKDFNGLIHFEAISPSNLRFAFPAVNCFYLNKTGLLSVVHSSGRTLNKSENNLRQPFRETNFLCKLNEDFEPFFHIFKGPKKSKNKEIEIIAKDTNNREILKTKKKIDLKKPLASKIIFLSKVLNKQEIKKIYKKNFFLIIKHSEKNIFGRLTAGNFDRKNDAFFTTHTLNSYEKLNSKNVDIVKPVKNNNSNIFYSLMSEKNLSLESKIYPTNQDFDLKFNIKKSNKSNKVLKKIKHQERVISGKRGKIFTKTVNNRNQTLLYANKEVPGRIYISLHYSFKDCRHPTDIGTSFNNVYMPEKKVHWGQVYAQKGYKNVFLIRNNSHKKNSLKEKIKCSLSIFNNKITKKNSFYINNNSFKVLKFENNLNNFKSKFISWKLLNTSGNVEVV